MLQLVKSLVRQAHQSALLIAVLRMNGDSEIQRHSDLECQRRQLIFILRADTTAESYGLLGIGLRQEDGEFVAADAKGKVRTAQGAAQRRCGKLQHLIALQVPMAIVHFLELVKVENHDCELLSVALRAAQ